MMGFIRWTLGFITALLITVFAVMNRHDIEVHWSPLHPPEKFPAYLIALGFLFTGFILGTVLTWLGSADGRRQSRARKKQIKKLEQELENLNEPKAGSVPSNDLFPVIPARIKR